MKKTEHAFSTKVRHTRLPCTHRTSSFSGKYHPFRWETEPHSMFFDAGALHNHKARKICLLLFIGGFFLLPVLWVVLLYFCLTYVHPSASYRGFCPATPA